MFDFLTELGKRRWNPRRDEIKLLLRIGSKVGIFSDTTLNKSRTSYNILHDSSFHKIALSQNRTLKTAFSMRRDDDIISSSA